MEQNKSLIDFSDSKPQIKTEQTTDIYDVAFSKLQTGQSNPWEEPLEVTKSLIPPPPVMDTSEEVTADANGNELSEAEKRLQRKKISMSCTIGYSWVSSARKKKQTWTQMAQPILILAKNMNIQKL